MSGPETPPPGPGPFRTGLIWITRAEPGAARTAARLFRLGYDPVVAPLLEIRPIPQAAPDLTGVGALVFTSRNGVAAFAALTPGRTPARDLPVLTVGEATAEAARAIGFTDVRSSGGDLQALARMIAADPPSGRILHPAAREPAGDLAALLGLPIPVRTLAIYEAFETGIDAPPAYDAVLLHSPRAARALMASPLTGLAQCLAIAISAAAAAPLADAGFRELRIAASPDEDALIAALGKAMPRV